ASLGLTVYIVSRFCGRTSATRGTRVAEAQRIVQAVSICYPQGFVPHSLTLLGRLTPESTVTRTVRQRLSGLLRTIYDKMGDIDRASIYHAPATRNWRLRSLR